MNIYSCSTNFTYCPAITCWKSSGQIPHEYTLNSCQIIELVNTDCVCTRRTGYGSVAARPERRETDTEMDNIGSYIYIRQVTDITISRLQ